MLNVSLLFVLARDRTELVIEKAGYFEHGSVFLPPTDRNLCPF